jgi:hypothetical protein
MQTAAWKHSLALKPAQNLCNLKVKHVRRVQGITLGVDPPFDAQSNRRLENQVERCRCV